MHMIATYSSPFGLFQLWEQTGNMDCHPYMCQELHITRSNKPITSTYDMHNEEMESVDTVK